MTTALVFAGRSFVGRPIVRALRRAGVRAVGTVRGGAEPPDALACDLTDTPRVEAILAEVRPDWIIQCAAATKGNDPHEHYAVHVAATLGLLGAASRRVPAATVLLFGSAAEYGPVDASAFPVNEDQPPRPTGFFGTSKLAQTHLAVAASAEWKIPVVVVRPFNVIGPGLPQHYFAASLAARLRRLAGEGRLGPFEVANLHATRDFVDVRDVADAVVSLLAAGVAVPGEMRLFNIATGVETPLRSVAELLGELAGGFMPVEGGKAASRGGASRSCGDAGRLRSAIGWRPRVGWEQSVRDMWADTPSSPLAPGFAGERGRG
jgi:GDP-4-dehydro-6-deoxy-D-mannose reductase